MFGLGHGEAAAKFAGRQRAQISFLLFRAAVRQQHFHVADIWCLAVEGKVAKRRTPEFFTNLRKFAKCQPQAAMGFRQRWRPQPLFTHLVPHSLQLRKHSAKTLA